jgi:hypothetical protein
LDYSGLTKAALRADGAWPARFRENVRATTSPTRFPLIVETLARLRSRSCIIDGEAVACDDNGVASFDLVRHHRANDKIFLYAFDLELNGEDMRPDPLQVRRPRSHLSWPRPALASGSTSISKATARPSSPMPARWDSKASCRSGKVQLTVRDAPPTGSK